MLTFFELQSLPIRNVTMVPGVKGNGNCPQKGFLSFCKKVDCLTKNSSVFFFSIYLSLFFTLSQFHGWLFRIYIIHLYLESEPTFFGSVLVSTHWKRNFVVNLVIMNGLVILLFSHVASDDLTGKTYSCTKASFTQKWIWHFRLVTLPLGFSSTCYFVLTSARVEHPTSQDLLGTWSTSFLNIDLLCRVNGIFIVLTGRSCWINTLIDCLLYL